ncbi:hypothetical protein MSPP1_002835 [Malassezia sp. CBS 17886]|nr:hypothetical protein MSPP1_002835 [Malassezia sp. CBS 17886]
MAVPASAGSESVDTALRAANQHRFSVDLEFLSALSNPFYLHQLSQQGYLDDPAFLRYLRRLDYFRTPAYAKYLTYPQALHFLDLLQNAEFRSAVADTAPALRPYATAPPAKEAAQLRDEAITAPLIRLVDPDSGKLAGPYDPRDIVQKIDRSAYALVQVATGAVDSARASWKLDDLPVCRLLSRREEYQKQRDAKKRRAQPQNAPLKIIRMSWHVSGHDRLHKVGKVRQELEHGSRVRVEIKTKSGRPKVPYGRDEYARRTELVEIVESEVCASPDGTDAALARLARPPEWRFSKKFVDLYFDPVK